MINYKEPIITQFEDDKFKPDINSLLPINPKDLSYEKAPKAYQKDYKTYIWLRPQEIWPDKKLSMFLDKMDILDIVQGDIGSCYFICSLFGLLSKEGNNQRIQRLFVTQEANKIGAYAVKFMKQGQYKTIVVDDYLPCFPNTKKLAFSYCKDSELWIPIIEKAWAKFNGFCYLKIWLGTPQEALAALSEAPTTYEHHQKYLDNGNSEDLWKLLLKAEEKKWILTTNAENIEHPKSIGLVKFHAYSIIQIYNLDNLKLIKMRNPWANSSWKGDYSFNSEKWTEELKVKVNFSKDLRLDENDKRVENGVFFITFEDYLRYFAWTFLCKHEDNFHYKYARFKFPINLKEEKEYSLQLTNLATCFIEVTKRTRCIISLYQPPKRYNHDINEFNIPQGMLILAGYNNGNYEYINSEYINFERLTMEQTLEPGEYHIFARCYWKYGFKKYKLIVSTYSESPLEIYQLNKAEISPNWYKSILSDLVLKRGRKKHLENNVIIKYLMLEKGRNETGFAIFLVDNKSNFKANISLIFSEFRGARVVDGKLNNNIILIDVQPKSTKSVILQYTDFVYNISVKYTHEVNFDYSEDQVIRKYLDTDSSQKKMLDDLLALYKVTYDNGVVLFFDNLSNNKYNGMIYFTKLLNVSCTKGQLDSFSMFFDVGIRSNTKIHFQVVDRKKPFVVDIDNNVKIEKL